MRPRFALILACAGAVLTASLAAIILLIDSASPKAPGEEIKDLADIVAIMVAAPVAMFLLVLWAVLRYIDKNR